MRRGHSPGSRFECQDPALAPGRRGSVLNQDRNKINPEEENMKKTRKKCDETSSSLSSVIRFFFMQGGGGDVVCHCCFVTGEQQHQEINALPVTYKMSRHQENMRAKALNLLSVCVVSFSIGVDGTVRSGESVSRARRDPFHLNRIP